MRDSMQLGDGVLFYHASCAEPGIVGIARVASAPCPDPTQFDIQSPYYDAASMVDAPRWHLVDIQVVRKIPLLALSALRCRPELTEMRVLRKSNRLSVMSVEKPHWLALLEDKTGL